MLGRGVWGVDAKRLLFEWANVAAKQRIDITAGRSQVGYVRTPVMSALPVGTLVYCRKAASTCLNRDLQSVEYSCGDLLAE